MATKTYSTIIDDMRNHILSLYPSAQTHEGSILDDIVIAAPARELAAAHEKVTLISEAQSVETAKQDGLEKIGSNFNKFQKPAIPALGIVTFFTRILPALDIVIPANTVVTTRAGIGVTEQQFRTIQKVTMYQSLGGAYLNGETGLYEISVNVEAFSPGVSSVVGSYTIDTIQGTITGIEGVYNALATSGGKDFEDETTFASRLISTFTGIALGTEDGFLTEVLNEDDVTSATVVGHGNTGRETQNAVDVYYKGTRAQTYTDVFAVPQGVAIDELVFTKQPVISGSILTVAFGSTGSVVGPVPTYTFTRDTGVHGGSIYGRDRLTFSDVLDFTLGTVYVVYSYNALSEDLQNTFTKTNKDILDVDILVKAATIVFIDMDLDVTILNGFDSVYVSLEIQNNIAVFLDSLDIGEELQMADVAREILNTTGVDDVFLPFTTFVASDGSIIPNESNNLIIPANGYPVSGIITINTII